MRGRVWGDGGMGGASLEGAELLGEVVDGCAGLAGDCVDFHFGWVRVGGSCWLGGAQDAEASRFCGREWTVCGIGDAARRGR